MEQLGSTPYFVQPRPDTPPEQWVRGLEGADSVTVHDTLEQQVQGLTRIRNPRTRPGSKQYAEAFEQYCQGRAPRFAGAWVYYPWRATLVHLLSEADFIELRTSRNRYKITRDEQHHLSGKAFGVVGLSVGAQVAVTMATERVCGELRLADFDRLELSNLNRLREGVFSLGLPKVTLAARTIAEIDPFLKVVCFPEGITEGNIERFLLDGGKLDLLVDECDGVPVKVMCRQWARAQRIPVVMEANDRAVLDIERFDLEPSRPILHGMLEGVDLSRVHELKTDEEKIPILLPMVGEHTMSVKLRASLIEVGHSIESWPQLASDVALGGALVTHVARRIALGQFNASGRYFVDLEQLVGAPEPAPRPAAASSHSDSASAHTEDVGPDVPVPEGPPALELDRAFVEDVVTAAQLAPSAANEQPWRWLARSRALWLWTQPRFGGRLAGFRELAHYLSAGAATENLVLRAHQKGREVELDCFPDPQHADCVARFRFHAAGDGVNGTECHDHDALVEQLEARCTIRGNGDDSRVSGPALDRIRARVEGEPGCSAHLVRNGDALDELAGLLAHAETLRLFHPIAHSDLVEEIRWTPEEAERTRDGVDLRSLELTTAQQLGLRMLRHSEVPRLLRLWEGGGAFRDFTRSAVLRSSAVLLVTATSASREGCFRTGRAIQRAWLEAARLDVALHPQTAAIFQLAAARAGGPEVFDSSHWQSLERLQQRLKEIFEARGVPMFLCRLFRGTSAAPRSLRRRVDETLRFG